MFCYFASNLVGSGNSWGTIFSLLFGLLFDLKFESVSCCG